MPDRYKDHASGLEGPATHAFSVTPNDDTDLTETTRALYIGSAGSLRVTLLSGAEVTLANVAAGSVLPIRVSRVKATSTTATSIVGLV